MKDIFQKRYQADQRVVQFCFDHNGVLILITEYAAEKLNLDNEMAAIAQVIINQGLNILPIAGDKMVDKDTLAFIVNKYALRAAVKAHQLGKFALEAALSKPLTYISRAEDLEAITRAKAQIKLMNDNIGILTNILPANIIEMNTELTDFTDIVNSPKQAIQVKKATGTDQIGPLLDEIDIPSHNIGKLVHSYNPELADEFDQVSKVGAAGGIHHIRIIVVYTDFVTGVHLPKVEGSLSNGVDPAIVKFSTKTGGLRDKDVPNGNYTLTSTLPGYQVDVQPNIGIETDKIVHLEIKLKKL
jgi:hypothetical protein